MVEFAPAELSVIVCCAESAALDRVMPQGALVCRVAPDELMLLSASADGAGVFAEVDALLGTVDPHALILDVSAGWGAWSLRGDDARAAFARVSAIPFAPGFAQGAVAAVPARVLIATDSVTILTASTLHHHIGRRLREACRDLNAVEGASLAWASVPA